MNVERRLANALGSGALGRSGPSTMIEVTDRESALRAVEILVETGTAFSPVGSGRRAASRPIRVRGPRGLFDLWPGELVARFGASTSLAEADSSLSPHGLSLGIDAPGGDQASLAGIFAAADRGLYGGLGRNLRDRVLGGTWVDGTASLRKAGARVVKNVAGYDLTRLHHGARGSLGVILDLTVRLQAREPTPQVMWIPAEGRGLRALLNQWREVGPSDPIAELWIGAPTAKRLGLDGASGLMVARQGSIEVGIGRQIDHEDFRAARDIGWIRPGWLLRWMAPSSQVDGLDEATTRGFDRVHDLSSGQSWISAPDTTDLRRVAGLASELEEISGRGSVWLERSPMRIPAIAFEESAARRAQHRIKRAFDPHGLLPDAPRPFRGSSHA